MGDHLQSPVPKQAKTTDDTMYKNNMKQYSDFPIPMKQQQQEIFSHQQGFLQHQSKILHSSLIYPVNPLPDPGSPEHRPQQVTTAEGVPGADCRPFMQTLFV